MTGGTRILDLLVLALALAGGLIGIAAWKRQSIQGPARIAFLLALGAAASSWVVRWVLAGHLPLFGTYESGISLALVTLLVAACLGVRARHIARLAWPVASLVAAAVLLQRQFYDPTPYALTISERSLVVDVHAIISWLAFGVMTANAGVAIAILVRCSDEDSELRWLSRSLSVGFLLFSAMIVSGSLYKFMLFGSAWSFDPIETLALAVWLAYATLLHMHRLGGWHGRKLARWCVGLFVALVVSYRCIVLFPATATYHIFDIDLRLHSVGAQSAP